MATDRSMLFSWALVERLPELRRLEFVLDNLPDAAVVAALQAKRGRGRDEYPVAALWRALVAGVVFGHESSASLLRELGRNPALLDVCGFDPLGRQAPPKRTPARRPDGAMDLVEEASPRRDGVPTPWAFSRFLSNVVDLEKETGAVSGMVDALRTRLMAELPGFGRHLGYDGKAVPSRSTGRRGAATGETSDPDADWGSHETSGVDRRTGKAWKKVKTWFGYGLHLVADVEHEIPVWFEVEKASASEHPALAAGLAELFGKEPELAARCEDFCADRGLDGGPLKRRLWDVWEVRPLIDVREMWREEKEMPGYDPSEPILRSLAGGRRRQRAAQREGRGVVPVPGDGRGAADGVPGLRGGPGHAEVPLPGGGVRLRVRGPGGLPARRRLEGRGLRAGGPGRPGGRRPADVHADAVGESVVAAGLRAAFGAGADQRAPGRQLRLREPLRARAGEDEDAHRAGGGGDDGAGARRGAGGTPGADALAGGSRAAARGLNAAPPVPRDETGPPGGALARRRGKARPNANHSHLRGREPVREGVGAPRAVVPRQRAGLRRRLAPPENPTAQVPPCKSALTPTAPLGTLPRLFTCESRRGSRAAKGIRL